MVPGHRGKKHKISSGRATGKYTLHYKTVKQDCININDVILDL